MAFELEAKGANGTGNVLGSLSAIILHANLEIVDWLLILSWTRLPGTVSMTTKSMGDSELRPIWKRSEPGSCVYSTMTA